MEKALKFEVNLLSGLRVMLNKVYGNTSRVRVGLNKVKGKVVG